MRIRRNFNPPPENRKSLGETFHGNAEFWFYYWMRWREKNEGFGNRLNYSLSNRLKSSCGWQLWISPKGKEYKNMKEYGPCWFTWSKYYMHLTWERIKKKETICGLSKFLKCQPPLLLLIFGCCAASGGKRRAVNKSRSWRHHHLDIHRYFISLHALT
jgi:hypothetical protein